MTDIKQLKFEYMQENFEQVLDDVLLSEKPFKITNAVGNAILVSEEIWRGITETLSLVSIPGMREPIADTAIVLDW